VKEFEAQLGNTFTARLDADLCRDFWNPDSLFAPSTTADDVAAFAAQFPAHETAVSLEDSSPAGLAALLSRSSDGRLVCGVYLHGLTLCTDKSTAASAETPRTAKKKRARKVAPEVPESVVSSDVDPHAILWPRLVAAMRGR